MIVRILIGVFYAAVFFYLGAWSGGHLKPVGEAIVHGAGVVEEGAVRTWDWAFGSRTDSEVPAHAVPKSSSRSSSPVATVEAARSAFSEGDFKAAIASYMAYLADHPGDADAHGELGNVYFNGGQTAEAAEAFHKAGLLFIAEGRASQAVALEPAIRTMVPSLADDLLRHLTAEANATTEAPHAKPTLDRLP